MVGKENREGQGRKPLARKNKEASESGEINVMVMRTEAIWNYIVLEKKHLEKSLESATLNFDLFGLYDEPSTSRKWVSPWGENNQNNNRMYRDIKKGAGGISRSQK